MKINRCRKAMIFKEIFPEIAEEEERLQGGSYRKKHVSIKELPAEAMDMEALLDEVHELSSTADEPAEEEYTGNTPWDDFHPTSHDLPFYVPMASMDAFRSLSPGKTRVKTIYHRGGKKIIPGHGTFV